MKAWLKGGLIGAVLSLILLLIGFLGRVPCPGGKCDTIVSDSAFTLLTFFGVLQGNILIAIIFYAILGAIIGLIIGKIKSKD